MDMTRLRGALPYLIVLAGAAYLYALAGHFEFPARAGQIGPDAWPRAILLLTMIACGYEAAKQLFSRRRDRELEGVLETIIEESGVEDAAAAEETPSYPLLLGAGIVLSALYVATLEILGFFTGTALYLALFMVLGRYRRPLVVLTASVVGSLAFIFIFMKVVYVSLPLGAGPFQALSVGILRLMGIH